MLLNASSHLRGTVVASYRRAALRRRYPLDDGAQQRHDARARFRRNERVANLPIGSPLRGSRLGDFGDVCQIVLCAHEKKRRSGTLPRDLLSPKLALFKRRLVRHVKHDAHSCGALVHLLHEGQVPRVAGAVPTSAFSTSPEARKRSSAVDSQPSVSRYFESKSLDTSALRSFVPTVPTEISPPEALSSARRSIVLPTFDSPSKSSFIRRHSSTTFSIFLIF